MGIVSSLVFGLILIYPLWKIFTRAGKNPALSLFIFIPLAGWLIVTLILAFSRWPAVEAAPASTE